MSDAQHSHPAGYGVQDAEAVPFAVERGIPFSRTCSRLQYFARRDYLKIGASGPSCHSDRGIPEIHCRADSIWDAPRMCPTVIQE